VIKSQTKAKKGSLEWEKSRSPKAKGLDTIGKRARLKFRRKRAPKCMNANSPEQMHFPQFFFRRCKTPPGNKNWVLSSPLLVMHESSLQMQACASQIYEEHCNMLKLRNRQARWPQFEYKHRQQDTRGHRSKWYCHDEKEAFFHKNFPLMSIGPNHEKKEHPQHITHKHHARSYILITRSSQTPTSYLMSCQSHRAMCPLLDMRLLIGEHHATV
jgi:hypothetical protein